MKSVFRISWLRQIVFACLLVSLFSFFSVFAATGDADLTLLLQATTLAPGQQTTATIRLDSSGLVLSGNEEISTISVFLEFPADKLEAIGPIDFTSSAFPTAYVGSIDNEDGTIEIVRARNPGTVLPSSATIGVVTFRARSSAASGNAPISFTPGLNNILLNDIGNSDVVGSLSGKTITLAPAATPSATPTASSTPKPTSTINPPPSTPSPPQSSSTPSPAMGTTKVWISADNADITSGQSTTATLHLDTGGKAISSIDLILDYNPALLEVSGKSIDVAESAFVSTATNTNNALTGAIELALFSNTPITSSDALIGSFTVTRKSSAETGIFFRSSSGAYLSDVNNTNVLSLPHSSGLIFAAAPGPIVTGSLSRSSLATADSVTVTFESSVTGVYTIRKDSCENYSVLAQGNVTAANSPTSAIFTGGQIGIGQNQKLIICVTDASAAIGRSPFLTVSVVPSPAAAAGNSKITFCSIAPNPVIAGQLSTLRFVADKTSTASIHRDSCAGTKIPAMYGGQKMTDIPVVTAAQDCTSGVNSVYLAANDVGTPGIYSLVVCVDSSPSQATTFTVSTSGGSSGGGGGSGSSGSGKNTNPSSTPTSTGATCAAPSNFSASSLPDGKIQFSWDKITDARITDLELQWGSQSGDLSKSIELPVVPTMKFPAEDLAIGMKYFFGLRTLGTNCTTNASAEISVVIDNNGAIAGIVNPPRQSGGTSAANNSSGGSRYPAAAGKMYPNGSSYINSNSSQNNAAIAGGAAGTKSHSISGGINGTNSNADDKNTAGERYAELPPKSAGSGPVALIMILIVFSGIFAVLFRRLWKVRL